MGVSIFVIVKSPDLLVYYVPETRKRSNFFWAFIILLGSLGLLLLAIFSYIGMDLFFFYKEISDFPFIPDSIYFPFIPQGITLFFYGIAGLLISLYLWVIVIWDVGSGYDRFDKKNKKVLFLRWGFPGKNRRIILEVPMEEVQSIRIITGVIEGSIFTRTLTYESIIYMETIEQGFIPLTRIEDNLIPQQIADKAAEIARFLGVPLLY
nr:photosystem I assembly protein Ycf4 [Flemingia sp.]